MREACARPSHFVIPGLLAAGIGLLTACGSSGGSAGGATGSSTPSAPSTVGSGPAAPAATVATSGAGTPADATTTAAIAKAFTDFFDYQSTAAQSQNALQDGDQFTAILTSQGKTSYAQKSAASVASASLLSANTAKVVFTVTVGGQALLPGATGYAVRQDGSWKVSASTFCGLLTLEGEKAAACNDPAVTALPK